MFKALIRQSCNDPLRLQERYTLAIISAGLK